jgi:hypothetical protein
MSAKVTPETAIIIQERNAAGFALAPRQQTTLSAFIDANRDGLSLQDISNIEETLNRGEVWHGGGGAAGAYTVERAPAIDVAPIAEALRQGKLVIGAPQDYRYQAMLAALKAIVKDVHRISGHWTEGLDNTVQQAEQAIKEAS